MTKAVMVSLTVLLWFVPVSFAQVVTTQTPERWDELLVYSKDLSVQEAVFSLTDDKNASRGLNAVFALGMNGGQPLSAKFRRCVGDPRVERIRQLLSELEPEEAAGQCKALYLADLKRVQSDWENGRGTVTECRLHSVSSLLFLCSEFCSLEEFDALCLKWELWLREQPSAATDLLSYGGYIGMDALLLTNMYANAVERDRGHDSAVEMIRTACRESLGQQFGQPERLSTQVLFSANENNSREYVYIASWGENNGLMLKRNPDRQKYIQLHHALRCEAIPEVRASTSGVASIKRWLDEKNLRFDEDQ